MNLTRAGLLFASALMTAASVRAAITFDNTYRNVGSFHSEGLYNLVGMGDWNGQPLSPSNQPTDWQLQLADTINLFVDPSHSNDLYIQITDVVTTNGAYWVGNAFQNVSLTGISFQLFPYGSPDLSTPVFSDQYANPGEVLFTGNGSETTPLDSTPGYQMDGADDTYSIHTINGASNAFGTWGYVDGDTRIMGGGVFELSFAPGTELLHDVNFPRTSMGSIFGMGNQYLPATLVAVPPSPTPTPEPGAWVLLGTVGLGLFPAIRRRCQKA